MGLKLTTPFACTVSSAALAIGLIAAPAAAQTAPSAPPPGQAPQDVSGPSGAATDAVDVADQAADAEAAPPQDESIVVTGFRGALRNALNIKRNSDVQVDAITAEDIADFPDTNLAESLQRLPGVSIDRDNGEGRSITVRGLGGDFNRTRLNGLEALSTSGANDAGTAPNRSRSFDYNTFASELFSSLKVQKTPSAETDEGSLGATIDLQTGRPFDYRGRQFALSTEASYQDNSGKTSPRIAGLASTRFMDGRMGILVSGAYSRAQNEIDQYARAPGSADYLYRGTQWQGNEFPQRAGFSAPAGTTFGTAITNPEAISILTGSDAAAYAKLFPSGYSTTGRFNDSLVRIPALAALQQQDVKNERIGLTASYQWRITDRTLLSVDGLYSKFDNLSRNNQISSVGLNRNNTNSVFNTAGNNLTPTAARALYPGLCVPNAGSEITPAQDCGQQLYGTTPAFATALNQAGVLVPSVLGAAAVVPGGTSPANANIFSTNPFNLDPYDYYNNPNSVGYIPTSNRLAFRGALIGRPGVDVLDANVTDGTADYLALRNVDFRSAVDQSSYTTEFNQVSANLQHDFTDNFRVDLIYGRSESTNSSTGLLVEFNRMDSPGTFIYDERDHGSMPVIDFGFDAADPANWDTVKGFSAIRHYQRFVKNTYEGFKADFDLRLNDQFSVAFGGTRREFGFDTSQFERNNDLLNPTLREAGATADQVGRVVDFGQGLNVPAGTVTSFYVPDIAKFEQLFDFTCNCANKWGDWRITDRRNNSAAFGVDETDTAFYLQADFNTEMFGRPLRGNIGSRVAITEVRSEGRTTAGREIVGTNKYTDWLPSMNLVYEPVENLFLRFGASRVMARPLLGNLAPTITAISIPNNGSLEGGSLTVGNPKLSPFYSNNLDASIEWYFAPGGLLSIAGFQKNISSFPQTVLFSAPLSSFLDADNVAALRQQFTNANQLAYIDADAPFTARQFRDAPGGYLRGFEISYQQDFTFLPGFLRNFGALINYTRIKSELNYILDPGTATIAPTTGKAPFLNVSPQALNGTLYYETERFRARVSVAHRKGYSTSYPIAAGNCSPGLNPVPGNPATEGTACDSPLINDFVFSRSTTNVDASMSYQLTDFLTITAEGLNLTNQASERYAYSDSPVVTQYASSGPIYRIGLRARF
ncbi:TonB-dependent receptor [Sphingomonas parva]|uniref:TonB-dependent receptor n=1 Tax=Sphingomonas parva TaxID=2555898 RepID=A0A4Y8ZR19_9SPHN|nr:TonB-dependent receptor [Sphingomonas parva]TFI57565.1 TonB-dependent receptor [Sphingomonas parva]